MKTTDCEDAVRQLEGHIAAGATIHLGTNGDKIQLVYQGPHGELGTHGDSIPEAVAELMAKIRSGGS